MKETRRQHFLVATLPAQGHINPAIYLAVRIAKTTGAHITFSTTVSGHRKMFPNLAAPDEEITDGPITYIPFTDGYDKGFDLGVDDPTNYLSRFKTVAPQSLSSIIDNLGSRGLPVDCVIYTFMLAWAADVARGHGIPSAQYWIQPATVFSIYHHAFHDRHGFNALISANSEEGPMSVVELPGLPPLRIHDLPSFLTTSTSSSSDDDDYYSAVLGLIESAFLVLDRERVEQKPKVLVNTFHELEAGALSAIDSLDLIPIGPILQSFPTEKAEGDAANFDLFKPDEKAYMKWLDSKPEKSVIYVSFGSLAIVKKEQMEEILKGLKESGRPYLWVVRKDCRHEGVELEEGGENAMVVEWCSQVRVLTHPSVGCFVTHCGWNSTLESLVFGVPTVGVPQWTDQGTNAMLTEKAWGTGVRGEFNKDGVLEYDELKRCLDLVMGANERGEEIKNMANMWKEKAIVAVSDGGSSDRNLKAFVEGIVKYDKKI